MELCMVRWVAAKTHVCIFIEKIMHWWSLAWQMYRGCQRCSWDNLWRCLNAPCNSEMQKTVLWSCKKMCLKQYIPWWCGVITSFCLWACRMSQHQASPYISLQLFVFFKWEHCPGLCSLHRNGAYNLFICNLSEKTRLRYMYKLVLFLQLLSYRW
jgi:hypothetical protein